jgi:hypothetical protein
VKAPDDQPTIGLLLCKEKNRLVAEYALRGVAKPIGVAEYQLLRQVPQSLKSKLPSIDPLKPSFGRICPTTPSTSATWGGLERFGMSGLNLT